MLPVTLNTPTSIYDAIKTHFIFASLKVTATNPVHLEINLEPNLPIVHLTSAVSKEVFEYTLHSYSLCMKISDMVGSTKSRPYLDPTQFSIAEPLTDWQTYRRVMFEMAGGNCIASIIFYLKNQDILPPEELTLLGFAPAQLEPLGMEITENDLKYFIEILDKNPNLQNSIDKKYPILMSKIRGIEASKDLEKVTETEHQKILKKLQQSVRGQVHATELVASVLSSQIDDPNCNNNFLFVGPSGTGKTELAKAIHSFKNKFIRFDMNQFPNEADFSKLFGSPTGTVGSDNRSYLASALDPNDDSPLNSSQDGTKTATISNVVILFDEFEKGHYKVRQSLLTLLDEGYVDLSYTKRGSTIFDSGQNLKIRYLLKKSVIIATSNLFQANILQAFHLNQSIDQIKDNFKVLNSLAPMHEGFSPEFFDRISIIPFGPIPKGDIYRDIIKSKAEPFLTKYKNNTIRCKEIVIDDEKAFYEHMESKLYGNGTGLRQIEKFFKETFTNAIATDRTKRNWGDISNKKLTLLIAGNELFIKLSTFSRGGYVDTPLAHLKVG